MSVIRRAGQLRDGCVRFGYGCKNTENILKQFLYTAEFRENTCGKEMTVKEYENMALMKSVVEENTSRIVESVTQFQKDAVIDEYTQQLIEEGLI